ncbi:MAG TPA: SGNH/GDSL hydrolase family protein [Hyphomonas sp.]|nr:SGNH/GDSL hydrolase family protein [Hyphomonas sp.]
MSTGFSNALPAFRAAGLAVAAALAFTSCTSASGTGPDRISRVLVIGDSMALGDGAGASGPDCGKTIQETARPDQAYGPVVATALGADISVLAVVGRGLVYNYENGTAPNMQTWLGYPKYERLPPRREAPGLVIIHLGTNDFYKHDAGAEFTDAYADLADHILSRYPHAKLVAMIGPMLDEQERSRASDAITAALARLPEKEAARATFIRVEPSELGDDWVGCDWRPTVAAHQKMAGMILSDLGLEQAH